MTNTQETTNLPSIDKILRNLKENPHFYANGMSEEMWMQEKQRDD